VVGEVEVGEVEVVVVEVIEALDMDVLNIAVEVRFERGLIVLATEVKLAIELPDTVVL
jgi:hypothetical protein